MRRQLVLAAAAITTTVVIAFLVPLAIAVRTLVADRALADAEQAARSAATLASLVSDPELIDSSLRVAAPPGTAMSAVLPGGGRLGEPLPSGVEVGELARAGAGSTTAYDGGVAVTIPAVGAAGDVLVVVAAVTESRLREGVGRAWAVLGALGLILIAVAVAVADRLARAVVAPVGALARAATRLGEGDLDVRVRPAGPPEIAAVGEAVNTLAGRIRELLAAERELMADLSHRLRTPLTALRLDAEALRDPDEAERLRTDADQLVVAVDEIIREARTPRTPDSLRVTDLHEVVRERTTFWSALADDQGRPWELDVPDGPCIVRADSSELRAALDAVLGNVFAHTAEGVGYRVLVEPLGMTTRCVVEDDGPGLAGEHVSRRGASGAGSTGLGLDIARRAAERGGGRLLLRAAAGGGARVELELVTEGPRTARGTG